MGRGCSGTMDGEQGHDSAPIELNPRSSTVPAMILQVLADQSDTLQLIIIIVTRDMLAQMVHPRGSADQVLEY